MLEQYVTPGASIPDLRFWHRLPFGLEDLNHTLKALPAFKAVPRHCASSILVKQSSEILAPILYEFLDEAWSNQIAHIPREWRTSWLFWLAKPGKPHHKGWRGISLQSSLGKAAMKAIVVRAKSHCFPHLCRFPQFAYLAGRSTGEAILRVMGHRAKALALGQSVFASHHQMRAGKQRGSLAGGMQFFMDIDGAFDRVARQTLLNALLFMDVPLDVVALLMNWHHHTPYIYNHDGSDIEIEANTGVRQGCVAAPLLWTAFTHVVMFVLGTVLSLEWLAQHLTLFADDLHASWEFTDEDELKTALVQLRILIDMLLVIGIRVNMEKSVVVQIHLRGTKSQSWRDKLFRQVKGKTHISLKANTPNDSVLFLPVVREHKYLGVVMSYGNAMDRTLGLRIQAANHAFIRLQKWWKPSLPLKARMDLWFQIIWPTLTYGLSDVGLTKKGITRFQTVVFKQWRVIGRSPVHLTRENNSSLLMRLGTVDPLLRLSVNTLRLWQRRVNYLRSTHQDDILHQVHSLCTVFRDLDDATYQWYVWCVGQWDQIQQHRSITMPSQLDKFCHPLDADIEMVARQLGATAQQRRQRCNPNDLDRTGTDCSQQVLALPPSSPLTCPHCGRDFPHQMSLRRHIRHQLEDCVLERAQFDLLRDSRDGMPTCRYCGMRFRYWLGLKQHVETRVCENLRNNTAVYARSIAVCENTYYMDKLGRGEWMEVLSQNDFKELSKQHCVFCHQWFPTAGALGYHLQRAHGEYYRQGKVWCVDKHRHKELIRITPCEWCGHCLADSSLPRHLCPILVQLGALLSFSQSSHDVGSRRGSAAGAVNVSGSTSEQRSPMASQQEAEAEADQYISSTKWKRRGKLLKEGERDKLREKEKTNKKTKKPTISVESLALNLARLAIRTEDHINRQRLDTAFMLHFPTTAKILPSLLAISRRWKELREGGNIICVSLRPGLRSIAEHLRHESDGTHRVQAAETGAEAISIGEGSRRAVECSFQTWRMNGRHVAVIPTFRNDGNNCYYISVTVALVRCMAMLEDDLTQPDFQHHWGILAELLRRASLEVVASLEAISDFSTVLSAWLEPGRQHDAAEFTHYLGTSSGSLPAAIRVAHSSSGSGGHRMDLRDICLSTVSASIVCALSCFSCSQLESGWNCYTGLCGSSSGYLPSS